VLAKSGMGVMVRTGAPKPDVSTVDAFKKTLLQAKSIAFPPGGQSGMYLVGLIDRLGLKDALKDKLKPIASGPLTGETVAKGEAEIGITPIGELLAVKGVTLVGPLPPDVQNYIVQVAGVSANAAQGTAARDFLKFLAEPGHYSLIVEKGMEPG
jgi:molybdate transport system substrate-binding protein